MILVRVQIKILIFRTNLKTHMFVFLDNKLDRISQLTDEILASILCFLSVKTSVLCWRWEKLWTTMIPVTPRLEFNCSKMEC